MPATSTKRISEGSSPHTETPLELRRSTELQEFRELRKVSSLHSRIDLVSPNDYRVYTPTEFCPETGAAKNSQSKNISGWQAAKDYYISELKKTELVSGKSFATVTFGQDQKLQLCTINDFNPRIAPSNQDQVAPTELIPQNSITDTYLNTVSKVGWEAVLFQQVANFLASDPDNIVAQLGIQDLKALSPQEAILLSSRVVFELSKYKRSDCKLSERSPSVADSGTVSDFLQEAIKHRYDPTWEGNGVCRNYAAAVKAVFEALKANQYEYNFLRTTHCFYERGLADTYKHTIDSSYILGDGHAWNSFCTTDSNGNTAKVVLDVTWGQALDRKFCPEKLDFHKDRAHDYVPKMVQSFEQNAVQSVMNFYDSLLAPIAEQQGASVEDNQRQIFYVKQMIGFLGRFKSDQILLIDLPPRAKEVLCNLDQYDPENHLIDGANIRTLFAIGQHKNTLPVNAYVSKYVDSMGCSTFHSKAYIFSSDQLQTICDQFLQQKPGYQEFVENSPDYRHRLRTLSPERFAAFDISNQSDRREFIELARGNGYFSWMTNNIDRNAPSQAGTQRLIKMIKEFAAQELEPELPEFSKDPLEMITEVLQLLKKRDDEISQDW